MSRHGRALQSRTLVALVIANMIGAGVFTTSGFSLADLGSPGLVLLAWATGGIIALCGATAYGGLIRLKPESGGEYLFLARGFHPLAGFLGGWVSLLAGFTGAIAYAAITFAGYAAPGLADGSAGRLVASGLIVLAAALHGVRLRAGTLAQDAGVAIKLAAITAFVAWAFTLGDPASWPGWQSIAPAAGAWPGIATFALSVMWISFSYSGFNAAVYLAGEVPDRARSVPGALLAGTTITAVAYLALNAVFVLAPDAASVAGQQDVAAVAALAIGGEPLAVAVRVLIALALVTSVLAMVMIGPRVYAKMADDNLFPSALRFRDEVPRVAVWMQAVLAVAVVWMTGLRELLSYLGFTLGLGTAATVATIFVFRRAQPDVRIPGYPWAPAIYIAATAVFAALGASQSPVELGAAAATIASGCLIYLAIRRFS